MTTTMNLLTIVSEYTEDGRLVLRETHHYFESAAEARHMQQNLMPILDWSRVKEIRWQRIDGTIERFSNAVVDNSEDIE